MRTAKKNEAPLRSLVQHLGYDEAVSHPEGRRLVFVGDLTDRGPDSPAVVKLVQSLIEAGRVQCVLGNHDFNILIDHDKPENKWFYGEEFLDKDGSVVPQVLADESTRQRVRAFFRTLPIALERDDLRVVHACWDDEMIDVVRDATDATSLYQQYAAKIDSEFAGSDLDKTGRDLEHQNSNPVKLITSGPEERSEKPIEAGGKIRNERRVIWWNDYDDAVCVFGHYSIPDGQPRGNGSSFCVDFGVGKRWTERRMGKTEAFERKLAAVRFPERVFVFDEAASQPSPRP